MGCPVFFPMQAINRDCLPLAEPTAAFLGFADVLRPSELLIASERSRHLRPEQRLVIRFDGPVAFADSLLQGFNIGDLNMASRILYHTSLLKRARMQRHAGPLDAQHFSKKFLGEL